MDYVMAISSTMLLAIYVSFSKKYQTTEGTGMVAGLRYAAMEGLFSALLFWALSNFKFTFSAFSLIMAFVLALFSDIQLLIGFQIMKRENMAVYTLFSMSGSMLLPYIFGVVFLEEDISFFRVLGLILILIAIAFSNRTKNKSSTGVYLLCTAVFILSGLVSVVSKCHQINVINAPVDSTTFVMYTGVCKFVLCTIAFVFCKKGNKIFGFYNKGAFWIIPLSALIGSITYLLQLNGAKTLPATVLYPIITGGGIVSSAFAGKVLFGEKLTKEQTISVLLCFIGTFMFL